LAFALIFLSAVGLTVIVLRRKLKHGERFQFGIPELLALPAALAPYMASAAKTGLCIELLLVVIYAASGAALGWAVTMKSNGGWIPALGLMAGAWLIGIVGMITLVTILAVTGHLA
jgi:hypothetical protein